MLSNYRDRTGIFCSGFAAVPAWLIPALLLLLLPVALPAAAAKSPTRILVLYSDYPHLPAISAIDQAFADVLRQGLTEGFELYTEFLDLDRFPAKENQDALARYLEQKYRNGRIDRVVTVRRPALDFLLQHRPGLFDGVPVVHASVGHDELSGIRLPPNSVSVLFSLDVAGTVALALQMHPHAKKLVALTGSSELDKGMGAALRRALEPLKGHLNVEYWSDLSLADALRRLSELPAHVVVIVPAFNQDANGERFVYPEALRQMSQASNAPIYAITEPAIGTGVVGGRVPRFATLGEQAAHAVLGNIQGLTGVGNFQLDNVFDWRALKRFRIPESALPPGSVIRFRELTPWKLYRWQILAVLLLLMLQTALIFGLLRQRRIRRRFEAELHESEQRMSMAARSANLGFWSWSPSGDDIWVSEHARELCGVPDNANFGFGQFLTLLQDDDRKSARQRMLNIVNGKDDRYLAEFRIVQESKACRWIAVRGSAERDRQGNPVRVRGVVVDVSDRKHAEIQVQRQREELERLSRAATLGQLSGAVAHELNQPLMAILINAQAALRFLKSEPVPMDELRETLEDIVQEDRRAGEVIERIRALFKGGESKRQLLDFNEVVREVRKLTQADMAVRNVMFQVELAEGLPAISGDRIQFQQVLLNLMLNACEEMASNAPEERVITLRTETDGKGVRVSLSDRGDGIEPDRIDDIFQPFVSTKSQGTGIGLSLCRNIVSAHGGRLWVENNQDRGATFVLVLPEVAQ